MPACALGHRAPGLCVALHCSVPQRAMMCLPSWPLSTIFTLAAFGKASFKLVACGVCTCAMVLCSGWALWQVCVLTRWSKAMPSYFLIIYCAAGKGTSCCTALCETCTDACAEALQPQDTRHQCSVEGYLCFKREVQGAMSAGTVLNFNLPPVAVYLIAPRISDRKPSRLQKTLYARCRCPSCA